MSSAKNLRDQEVLEVLRADGPTRYAHFVSQVADWEAVWALRGPNGWVSVSDASEAPMFPVWPHERYAQLLATDSWANATPTPIEVHEWVERWLPGLARDGIKVAVFPTPGGKGVVVDPVQLLNDLQAELARLE